MLTTTRRAFLGTVPAGVLLAQGLPVQCDWQNVDRIVAIGDVHGDLDALRLTMHGAGLLNEAGGWNGGRTHCVQIGDIAARGPQTRSAYEFLMHLEPEAIEAGGRLHALIGNHDAMPMYHDMRNLTKEEFESFRTAKSNAALEAAYAAELKEYKRRFKDKTTPELIAGFRTRWMESHPPGFFELQEAFSPSGRYGGWIRKHNSVIRINRNLFVHGGISPTMLPRTMDSMNAVIRAELADPLNLLPGLATSPLGPLWYRGLAEAPEEELRDHVDDITERYEVDRVIIGHTVTIGAILPRFDGRVFDIDLGLSRFYGRPPASLVIEPERVTILHNGASIVWDGDRKRYLEAVAEVDPNPDLIVKWAGSLPS